MKATGVCLSAQRVNGRNPGWGRSALVPMLTLAVVGGGCCSEKEKEEVRRRIDRTVQILRENCGMIQESALRDQCFFDINPEITKLESKYLDYLTACAQGNVDLARDILRQIRPIVISAGVEVLPNGDVVNDQFVLFRDDMVQWNVVARRDEVSSCTSIDESLGLAHGAAMGRVMLGSSLPTDAVAADMQGLEPWLAVQEWRYTLSGTIALTRGGMSYAVDVSGDIWFASPPKDWDASGLTPTRALITLNSALGSMQLTLTLSSPHNRLTIDANGDGSLQVQTNVSYTGSLDDLPLRPETMLMRIPARVAAGGGSIELSTFGEWVKGTQITPVAPFPVADFDNDGTVSAQDLADFLLAFHASLPEGDVDYDGVVGQDDYDYFLAFWQYEMGN